MGCRGNALVQGGWSPPAKNKFGYFGDQFAACRCTEIVKTIFLFLPWTWSIRINISLLSLSHQPIFKTTNIKSDSQDHKNYLFPLEHFKIYVSMSHDLPHYKSWDDSSSTKSYEQFINYENASWKCCACEFCNSIVSKQRLECHKTDMCAVVGHQVAELNTVLSCPVYNLRCNRWVQHDYTNKLASFHSRQGGAFRPGSKFSWCASELACLMKTTAPLSA